MLLIQWIQPTPPTIQPHPWQPTQALCPLGAAFPNSFTGSLDGKGFTISNLYINVSGATTVRAGLFGYVAEGEVQNLGMVNAYVKAEATGSGSVYAGDLWDIISAPLKIAMPQGRSQEHQQAVTCARRRTRGK